MSFINYLLHNKRDNVWAVCLLLVHVVLYILLNMPFIVYMQDEAQMLAAYSPFYGAPFTLNLFNFDPSMYYATDASVIHPLKNLIGYPLSQAAHALGGNLFFLVLQSVINALSVVFIYYYLRRSGAATSLAAVFAVFFGVSSYSLFTALIPDSYPYVQLLLIFGTLYLHYSLTARKEGGALRMLPTAALAFINFGMTSTNIVPFLTAVLIGTWERVGKTVRLIVKLGVSSLLMVAAATGLQQLIFHKSWVGSWMQSLSDGGFSYVAPFSFAHHWQAFYMLLVNPVLTPTTVMNDKGLVAVVTDLAAPYPWFVHLIGGLLVLMAVLGFVRGWRSREVWMLAGYIGFALALHIVVGFGLGAFQYDMYLYAGHYLFAIFLLAARFAGQLPSLTLRRAAVVVMLICVVVTLANNYVMHGEMLEGIKQNYAEIAAVQGE
ncbi:hypothetical protein EBB07_09340 [Paenibacillaceae bacterium]|nr:hypothetical protein EBB07_09340 [Paenibacillaceae bacterium]